MQTTTNEVTMADADLENQVTARLRQAREQALRDDPEGYNAGLPPSTADGAGNAGPAPTGGEGVSVLLPTPSSIAGHTIRRWTLGDLRHMQSALSLLAVTVTSMQPYALTDEELVHTLLQNSPDAMATVVGHTIGISQEALNEMDYDQFFELAVQTYKVNISFFSRSRTLAQRLVDASADARP